MGFIDMYSLYGDKGNVFIVWTINGFIRIHIRVFIGMHSLYALLGFMDIHSLNEAGRVTIVNLL